MHRENGVLVDAGLGNNRIKRPIRIKPDRRSPIQVLTWPNVAWLQWSEEMERSAKIGLKERKGKRAKIVKKNRKEKIGENRWRCSKWETDLLASKAEAKELVLLDAGEAVLIDAEDLVLLDAGEPILLDAEEEHVLSFSRVARSSARFLLPTLE